MKIVLQPHLESPAVRQSRWEFEIEQLWMAELKKLDMPTEFVEDPDQESCYICCDQEKKESVTSFWACGHRTHTSCARRAKFDRGQLLLNEFKKPDPICQFCMHEKHPHPDRKSYQHYSTEGLTMYLLFIHDKNDVIWQHDTRLGNIEFLKGFSHDGEEVLDRLKPYLRTSCFCHDDFQMSMDWMERVMQDHCKQQDLPFPPNWREVMTRYVETMFDQYPEHELTKELYEANLASMKTQQLYETYSRTAIPLYMYQVPHDLVQEYGPLVTKMYQKQADNMTRDYPELDNVPDNFALDMKEAFARGERLYSLFDDLDLEACIHDYEFFNAHKWHEHEIKWNPETDPQNFFWTNDLNGKEGWTQGDETLVKLLQKKTNYRYKRWFTERPEIYQRPAIFPPQDPNDQKWIILKVMDDFDNIGYPFLHVHRDWVEMVHVGGMPQRQRKNITDKQKQYLEELSAQQDRAAEECLERMRECEDDEDHHVIRQRIAAYVAVDGQSPEYRQKFILGFNRDKDLLALSSVTSRMFPIGQSEVGLELKTKAATFTTRGLATFDFQESPPDELVWISSNPRKHPMPIVWKKIEVDESNLKNDFLEDKSPPRIPTSSVETVPALQLAPAVEKKKIGINGPIDDNGDSDDNENASIVGKKIEIDESNFKNDFFEELVGAAMAMSLERNADNNTTDRNDGAELGNIDHPDTNEQGLRAT